MMILISLILCAVALALLIVFFVLFLVFSAKHKALLDTANKQITETVAAISQRYTETKELIETCLSEMKKSSDATQANVQNLVSNIIDDTKHINAKTAEFVNQKYVETIKLIEATQTNIQNSISNLVDETRLVNAKTVTEVNQKYVETTELLKSSQKELYQKLQNELADILKEIKAPLEMD